MTWELGLGNLGNQRRESRTGGLRRGLGEKGALIAQGLKRGHMNK